MAEGKWISVLAAWEGSNDYGNYIMVKPEEGYELVILKNGKKVDSFDAERSMFLNENQYRKDNPKAPNYKMLRKSFAKSHKVDDYIADEVAGDIPF